MSVNHSDPRQGHEKCFKKVTDSLKVVPEVLERVQETNCYPRAEDIVPEIRSQAVRTKRSR